MRILVARAPSMCRHFSLVSHRRVRTFDPRHLGQNDFISVERAAEVHLTLPRVPATPGKQNRINFRGADTEAPRIEGFLYYHVNYPRQFLSGELRFRCCPDADRDSFAHGHDLPSRDGLPWGLSLPLLLGLPRYSSSVSQLVADGMLTSAQVAKAKQLLMSNPARFVTRTPFIHDITQPFRMDLAVPTGICVLGPHCVLRAPLYRRVALHGSVLVRLERTPHEGELALRVVRRLEPCSYLEEYRHLDPLREGMLLSNADDPDLMWTWTYEDEHPKTSAALHCLFHPPCHFRPPDEDIGFFVPVAKSENVF
ncbi:hypothetical protein B0H15DRAFT_848358 [Mycena belliarum]|uniref:Uncharacterized protein n=1 Tax=Mycena belliarum TaxID=1033014 RepID=A0AAD6U1I9_9AGAR|nr:hypothetical protein B0H15DRAFT_848358 [Mycena belliae]